VDEKVLVFHCIIHPDVVLAQESAASVRQREEQNQDETPPSIPIPATLEQPPAPTPTTPANNEPTPNTAQPPPISPWPAQDAGPWTPRAPAQSMRISAQTPAAAQHALQQTITQLTANPPIRPSVQIIPVQYQAVLIKYLPPGFISLTVSGLPFLSQLQRPQIRLTSDTVIPVTTHEGQQALIVSPAGVVSLAQQGYRVEVRVFAQNQQQRNAAQQPQIPLPERRFGLADFISLFRRRLGQQLWLMCKLAFMVGIFSSNNASWRRIIGLVIAAAGIFCTITSNDDADSSLADGGVGEIG
jgi:hypothetical protein